MKLTMSPREGSDSFCQRIQQIGEQMALNARNFCIQFELVRYDFLSGGVKHQ